jgi:DNA-binding CsgD family transcriptional regulator
LAALFGRTREKSELAAVLEAARGGRSAALVVHGEAGIGKSTLLAEAVASATGFRVLRARGYESESGIPFAGLLDLLTPLLDLLDRIPEAQARALRGAMAIEEPSPHDKFAVPAAVLSVLGAAAEDQPLLAVVDDVHWLDEATLEALLFTARRLDAEGIVLLLGIRDGEGLDAEELGLARLRVMSLDETSGRALLEQTAPGVAPLVAMRLLETAGGNPLALVEIPSLLTGEQISGREALPETLPAGSTVEGAFRRQLAVLPADTRRALTVVTAMRVGRVDVLHAALDRLEIPRAALGPAEDADVIRYDAGRVEVRHPLLRSTIYHAATAPERRAAHEALAETVSDVRRRAWHLAIAAVAPDEEVAAGLEAAGLDARTRGGSAAAAAAFERAAELSVEQEPRARRELEAARDLAVAGGFERALTLLDAAGARTRDPLLQADLRRARGHVELRRGAPRIAYELLDAEARRIQDTDPARAAETLIEASVAHMMTGDMHALEDAAARACALAGGGVHPALEVISTLIIGECQLALGRTDDGNRLLDAVLPVILEGDVLQGLPEVVGMAGHSSVWVEQWDRAELVLGRLVEATRQASALGLLIYPLAARSHLEFRRGRWQTALADAGESVELARQTGQIGLLAHALAALADVESGLGRSADAQAHGREALELTRALGSDAIRVYALNALALDDVINGRIEQAIEELDEAHLVAERCDMQEPALVQWAPTHVEALARAGETDRAHAALERFAAQADRTQRTWALAATERCRGMLAGPDDFAGHFERALAHHAGDGQPFERARTHLAFAERLRRGRQRADARPQLTAALEIFDRLGATQWAARARAEMTATGGPTGPRAQASAAEGHDLTPSELKIALLVAQGMTNREVAASLFLSPKTVEHHLSHIYRKLDVRSRTQLARLFAEERPPAGVA